jgi:hypothetical protein
MSVKTHVQEFLSATDPQRGLRRMAELTVETLKSDTRARKSFPRYLEWVNHPPLSKRARDQFDKTHRSKIASVGSRDQAESTLAAAGFLWMQQKLPTGASQAVFFERFRKGIGTSDKHLDKLEPDFLGELLAQTSVRAAENDSFARQLDNAARSFDQELRGRLDLWKQVADLMESAPKKSPPASKRSENSSLAINSEDVLMAIGFAVFVIGIFGLGFTAGQKAD